MSEIKKATDSYPNLIVTKTICPYCVTAKKFLQKHNIEFKELKAEENMDLVKEVRNVHSHMTVPIVFLNKKFIGGCDDLIEYLENNENKNNF